MVDDAEFGHPCCVPQIRNSISRNIVGTGFVLDIDGLIATCWHVVEVAGVIRSTENRVAILDFLERVQTIQQ